MNDEARNPCNADDSFWNEDTELVVREETKKNRVYDLEERTAQFGEAIIDFAKTIPQTPITNRIITQLVGAGTSVGANYARRLFRHSSFVIPSCFGIRISSF